MKQLIAYCGLDCQKCEAHIATINDDDELRKEVASKWSKLNNVLITPSMINCVGCKPDGIKNPFCEKLCPIRMCILQKKLDSCGDCELLDKCEKIKMIISNNDEAYNNLTKKK